MAEIILELNGRGGLAKGFAGSADMITPKPENLTTAKEGELASGLFNPYLREGYLAPATTTSTEVTLDTTPASQLTSVKHDSVSGKTFYADRGKYIYRADDLTDITLTKINELSTGDTIQDLEIYEIDSTRKLFYTYTKDTGEFAQEATVSATTGTSDWTAIGVRIDPYSTVKPSIILSEEVYKSSASITKSVTVPAKSNMAATILVVTRAGTTTGVTVGGNSMTLVDSWKRNTELSYYNFYLYTITGVSSGTQDVIITNAGSYITKAHMVFTDETSATPITVYNKTNGVIAGVVTKLSTNDNSEYLQFIMGTKSRWDISTAVAGTTFDETAQTGDTGQGIYVSPDGTKMYVDGRVASVSYIFQYTLSSPYILSTATYDTKSLNINSKITGAASFTFSDDGTKLYAKGYNLAVIYRWTLSTAWDITTATYDQEITLAPESLLAVYGLAISHDGTELYFGCNTYDGSTLNWVYQYTLSIPYDITTATYTSRRSVPVLPYSIDVSSDTGILMVKEANANYLYIYTFDSLYPHDVSKTGLSSQTYTIPTNSFQVMLSRRGSYIYARKNSNSDAISYIMTTGNVPTISSNGEVVLEREVISGEYFALRTVREDVNKILDCGILDTGNETVVDDTWLSETIGSLIQTKSEYNFIRLSDNGFGYLFTGNAVHKIDGGFTGGGDGTVTKNVLLFPNYFTITDAIDYRSKFYIAVHHYPVDSSLTKLDNFTGTCGIVIWGKNSTQLGGVDFIELPGVREIKRIFSSPDGLLKLLVINDAGLTELRQFGYNDSGGAIFSVSALLGIGAHPQFPDGVSSAGDKTIWLGNDGTLYSDKGGKITKLFQVKTPGTTSDTTLNNISSGIVLYGSGDETSDSGYRSNKQGIILSYDDSGVETIKIYPFDLKTGANGAQTPHQGDVYTGVVYIPLTSIAKSLRVYNLPTVTSGTDVIARVKIYFNQSTTATMPTGMTKSITQNEAKRGYVDFHIDKPNVHAVQVEVEWASGTPIGDDTYMPSVAIITHEPTKTKSPDNG